MYFVMCMETGYYILLGLFALGITAGVLSGMFGIGGGIVMVPIMVAIFGMELLNANATSLAAMLLPVGIMGVISYYKAGYVRIREALWISLGLFAGSFVGAELAISVDVGVLSKLYAGILVYVAVSYLFARKNSSPTPSEGGESKSFLGVKKIIYLFGAFVLTGIAAGIFAGLFGKGGALVIIPVLIKIFKYSPKAAAATSLTALQLPVGLPSVFVYAHDGYLNLSYAAIIALGIVAGTFFGTKFALKIPNENFKQIYAFFLLFVAVYMVWKYI